MPLSLTRWRESEPEEIRSWITEVNDGIIAVAGMGLGLAGADVEARTTYAVVIINAFVGALVAFGAKLGDSSNGPGEIIRTAPAPPRSRSTTAIRYTFRLPCTMASSRPS